MVVSGICSFYKKESRLLLFYCIKTYMKNFLIYGISSTTDLPHTASDFPGVDHLSFNLILSSLVGLYASFFIFVGQSIRYCVSR